MLLSVITVTLFVNNNLGDLNFHSLKVGGLNETEIYDLKQLPAPFLVNSEVEMNGTWIATFRMSREHSTHFLMIEPPIELVAPFLSRVKSWGYKITFFNTYAGEAHRMADPRDSQARIPILSYNWMLEKDSELRFLSPPLTTPPTENIV